MLDSQFLNVRVYFHCWNKTKWDGFSDERWPWHHNPLNKAWKLDMKVPILPWSGNDFGFDKWDIQISEIKVVNGI